MLLYITSRVISSTAAFLYPGYASYKTLSQRPASEADLERWLMYWSVLGCIVGVEYVAEWLVSWLPFYYPIKTLFLLYLSLPQTRGSSYLYTQHLQPFFHTHESDIDAALLSLKSRVYTFVQERARLIWEHIVAILGQSVAAGGGGAPTAGQAGAGVGAAAPPTLNDPVSGPMQLIGGLWRTYGPSIVASGAALLHQSGPQATGGASSAFFNVPAARTPAATPSDPSRPPVPDRNDSTQSVLERRRQLEAELAALAAQDAQPIPVQRGSSAYSPVSPTGSDADLRARVSQYEEIEVPSDVEGYDMRPKPGPADSTEQGHSYEGEGSGAAGRPASSNRRSSWFGWAVGGGNPAASGSGSKGAYERVKDE